MDITYTLTLEDYRKVIKHFAKKNTSVKFKSLINHIFPPFIGFIVLLMSSTFTYALTYGILVSIIWLPLYSVIQRMRIRKQYNLSRLDLSRSITLEEDGILIIAPVSKSTIKWAGILQIYDDHKFLYFMTAKSQGIFVPKTAFSSSAEAAEFLLKAQTLWYQNTRNEEHIERLSKI